MNMPIWDNNNIPSAVSMSETPSLEGGVWRVTDMGDEEKGEVRFRVLLEYYLTLPPKTVAVAKRVLRIK